MDEEKAQQKDDLVGRRVNDIGKLAGWANRDILALVAIFFMICTGILLYLYVKTYSDLNDKILEEVRRQVPRAIQEQVPVVVDSKLEGVKEGVNKALDKVDTIVQKINQEGKR